MGEWDGVMTHCFLWLYNSKIVTDKEESANSYSNFMVKLVYKCSFLFLASLTAELQKMVMEYFSGASTTKQHGGQRQG